MTLQTAGKTMDDLDRAKQEVARMSVEIEQLRKDAEQWRAYKARKDAVISAGMGRNPLRKSAFDTLPDDYEVN